MSMIIKASSLMQRAYAGNVLFKDESYRKNSTNHDVVRADRKAMERVLERLEALDFENEEDENKEVLYNTISSYLDVYNNAVDATRDSASSDIKRTSAAMKKLTKEYAEELNAIGITVKNDGSVKVDESKMKKATPRQMSKIFGNSEYITDMKKMMRKLRNQISREVPPQQVSQTTHKDSLLPETVGSNLNLSV